MLECHRRHRGVYRAAPGVAGTDERQVLAQLLQGHHRPPRELPRVDLPLAHLRYLIRRRGQQVLPQFTQRKVFYCFLDFWQQKLIKDFWGVLSSGIASNFTFPAVLVPGH